MLDTPPRATFYIDPAYAQELLAGYLRAGNWTAYYELTKQLALQLGTPYRAVVDVAVEER